MKRLALRPTLVTLLFACVALHALPVAAAEPLPRDDRNVYGRFDNGMAYVIRSNATPPGRVMLYLHIKTGALNESDDQNGLAHFIEHMTFNGSEHFPPGKLVPMLSSLGMTFGADTNAHTNLRETVYKLNLPDTKPDRIEMALQIFADYAKGLSFATEEIDAERKVILEEARSKKSAGERIRKQVMKQVYAGTRLAVHDVIGDEDQIRGFSRAQFLDYWTAWYRPEAMTLVIVGDVKPEDVLPKAKELLGGFKAQATARQALKAGIKPTTADRAFVFTDPEQVSGEVELAALYPGRATPTTYEQYRAEVVEQVATRIVNRRFRDLISKGGAPFRGAGTSIGEFMNDEAVTAGGEAAGEPQDWNRMLDALIAEISRACEHGFSDAELDLVRKGMLAAAEQAVRSESTRDSAALITGITGAIGMERPILSATQRLDLLRRALGEISVEELHKIFAKAFETRNYIYIVTVPSEKEGFKPPTTDDVLAAARAAWAKKTQAPTTRSTIDRILAAEPDPGKVISKETDADLAITTIRFANGVVMHHKFSDYKKDSASVRVMLPGGTIEETADTRALSDLASLILARPATSRFASTQVRDLLTGKNVGVSGGIGRDEMTLAVSGNPRDLASGMQLAYALLTDGVLEQSAVDDWRKAQLQGITAMKQQPAGQLREAMAQTLYGGDVRFQPLTPEVVNKVERSEAERWFKRIAASAAIEVAVVGDLSLDDATDLVARYVGSLPARTGKFNSLDKLRSVSRAPGPFVKSVTFDSVTPRAMAMAGFINCDELSPDRRPLLLAADILSERMIARLREKEQLVYGIRTQSQPSIGVKGTGTFAAVSTTDPQNAERLADEILAMMKEFAEKGPSEEELATAKKQTATRLTTAMKEPQWWLAQIGELSYRGRPLDDLKQLPGVFQTFTAEQVRQTFARYFKEDAQLRYVIIPRAKAGATTGATSKPLAAEPIGAQN